MIYVTTSTQTNIQKGLPVYEASVAVASGETSDPIIMPDEAGPGEYWQLALIVGTNSGRFEYTLSPRSDIEAGTANWIQWDSGNVSSNTSDSLFPVQAVRVVSVSGGVTGEVMVI